MAAPIVLPLSRQHRLLALLGLTPEDGVLEILLTPDGGLVTTYKTGPDGAFVVGPQGEPITETHEVYFQKDTPDPLASSREYRAQHG